MTSFGNRFSSLSPASLILVPIKQHLGCCVILPLLMKIFGGAALGAFMLENPWAEFAVTLGLAPLLVYAIMKLEDKWKARTHKEKDPCVMNCCKHTQRRDFMRRFVLNLALALAIAFAVHTVFHDHDHDHDDDKPVAETVIAP